MKINYKIFLFSSLLLTISTSSAYERNIELKDQSKIEYLNTVRFDSETKIKSLLIKSEAETQSIILYVQDSKCKSSAKQFFKLTESLDNSFARLYVEKIGESDTQKEHGQCSESFLSNGSLEQRISDYHQVLTQLRTTAPWWDQKLYIIGEAEGGLIAGLIAASAPETNKLAILNFGGGMTMSEAWIASLTKTMLKDGKSSAEIEEMQQQAKKFFKDKITKSNDESELARNITYKWWASVVDVRLSDTLSEVDFPIYLAHGTEDSKFPVESAQQLSDLFSTLEKDNLVYNEYTGSITKVSHCKTNLATKPVFTEAVNWLVN